MIAETFMVDGVAVTNIGLEDFTEEEARRYVDYVRERVKHKVNDYAL